MSPNEDIYKFLLSGCGYHNTLEKIPFLKGEMIKYHVPLTLEIFTALVETYARSSKWLECVDALEEVRSKGIVLDRYIVRVFLTFLSAASIQINVQMIDARNLNQCEALI